MFERIYYKNRDLLLVGGLLAILAILFAPIPPAIVDLAIIANFGLALTILLMTFYVARPVDFSTFPSLLLVVTLLRLAINVAATRLILTTADAGDVIRAVGSFAVGGNYIVGVVVFAILVVVQYVVVTSGAQRVSEVAARFTLDSMPGQQMSIDADLNMGLIDQTEAQRRRHELEQEASFYGAMDGASKFVKGDAIAAIIILLINIIAGSLIGIIQLGLTWSEALQRFTLLTIGDGIAAQLPALIVSVATGIIVTRSAADRDLSTEIFAQLASISRIPKIVGAALLLLMLLPGMPKWPIVLLLAIGVAAVVMARRQAGAATPGDSVEVQDDASTLATPYDGIELLLGPQLADEMRDRRAAILESVAQVRAGYLAEYGMPLPPVRVADGDGIGLNDCEIRVAGVRQARFEIFLDRILAIADENNPARLEGLEARDLPQARKSAFWILPSHEEQARSRGFTIADPVTVIRASLAEIVRVEATNLLTRPAVSELVEAVRRRQPGLVDDLIPAMLSLADVQRILKNLLTEQIPVANLDLILEHLVDLARTQRDPEILSEMLRQRIGHVICDRLRGRHRDLAVISLDPRLENEFRTGLGGAAGMMDARAADRLVRRLQPVQDRMLQEGRAPVLLCGAELRRAIRMLTRRALPRLSVISVAEIPERLELASYDVVAYE